MRTERRRTNQFIFCPKHTKPGDVCTTQAKHRGEIIVTICFSSTIELSVKKNMNICKILKKEYGILPLSWMVWKVSFLPRPVCQCQVVKEHKRTFLIINFYQRGGFYAITLYSLLCLLNISIFPATKEEITVWHIPHSPTTKAMLLTKGAKYSWGAW